METTTGGTTATGYLLCLVPQGENADKLAALMNSFAERPNTPVGALRIPLLAGLAEGRERLHCDNAERLAKRLSPMALKLGRPGWQMSFFRFLVIEVELIEALTQAFSLACRIFQTVPREPFVPWVPLVFDAEVPLENKQYLCRVVGREVVGQTIHCADLQLIRTANAVADWQVIETFSLGQ